MATIKLVLDKRREKKDGSFPLVFRINHNTVTRDIHTGYSIQNTEWDGKKNIINKTHPAFKTLSARLKELESHYLTKLIEFERSHEGPIDVQELREYLLGKPVQQITVYSFWEEEIEHLHKANRNGSAKIYS
ncbi:MAG: integrase family protein [Bacteroidetes bacterium]|nr:MAG: integrase family protein [Bacteroidota bacterium]